MSHYDTPVELRVWGDFACFTRPEHKVERVTYCVPTPSAARGILEAIFWKPEIFWEVEEIWILKPIKYFSIRRNEVKNLVSENNARKWEKQGGNYIAPDDRAQRDTLALRDVAYRIRAQIKVKAGVNEDPAKYRDQFRRRVKDGRCFATPYLGCREFSASFSEIIKDEQPIDVSVDLGLMLFDLDFDSGNSGRGTPISFPAYLEKGVLRLNDQLRTREV